MAGRFQFSIRFLLVATALVATGICVVTVEPSWQTGVGLILVGLSLPAAFLAGAVYGRDWMQAFCLGATVPTMAALVALIIEWLWAWTWHETPPFSECLLGMCNQPLRLLMLTLWTASLPVGLVALVSRWLVASRDQM